MCEDGNEGDMVAKGCGREGLEGVGKGRGEIEGWTGKGRNGEAGRGAGLEGVTRKEKEVSKGLEDTGEDVQGMEGVGRRVWQLSLRVEGCAQAGRPHFAYHSNSQGVQITRNPL